MKIEFLAVVLYDVVQITSMIQECDQNMVSLGYQ